MNIEPNDLIIHIRGGDIFRTFMGRNYAQPPLCYYEKVLNNYHFFKNIYIVSIDHSNIVVDALLDKYKNIIDYTYERTDVVPEPIKIYGYPAIVDDNIKNLAIKNIGSFVPAENEVQITPENYETYLTNSYLDSTQSRKDEFSIRLCITLLLLFIVVGLLIITIFDKDKIVDNIDDELEKTKRIVTKDLKKKKKE